MAPSYCCVHGCPKNAINDSLISLFRFPLDEERCYEWVKKCGRLDLMVKTPKQINSTYRLCAMHFESVMFGGIARLKLKRNAIPTLFPERHEAVTACTSGTLLETNQIPQCGPSTCNSNLIVKPNGIPQSSPSGANGKHTEHNQILQCGPSASNSILIVKPDGIPQCSQSISSSKLTQPNQIPQFVLFTSNSKLMKPSGIPQCGPSTSISNLNVKANGVPQSSPSASNGKHIEHNQTLQCGSSASNSKLIVISSGIPQCSPSTSNCKLTEPNPIPQWALSASKSELLKPSGIPQCGTSTSTSNLILKANGDPQSNPSASNGKQIQQNQIPHCGLSASNSKLIVKSSGIPQCSPSTYNFKLTEPNQIPQWVLAASIKLMKLGGISQCGPSASNGKFTEANEVPSMSKNSLAFTLPSSFLIVYCHRENSLKIISTERKPTIKSNDVLSQSNVKQTQEQFLSFCRQKLSPTTLKFIKNCVEHSRRNSPVLVLTSKKKLQKKSSKWYITAHLNGFTFDVLGSKGLGLQDSEKHCVLCVDEMKITKSLFYKISRNQVVGFPKKPGSKKYFATKKMLVLMARGIVSNWEQPVAYVLVDKYNERKLKHIIFKAIRKLKSVGLIVSGLVSKQKSKFVRFANSLNVSPNSPYFFVDGDKIFYFFDVPFLLKSTRNNFFQYTFKISKCYTHKVFLEELYKKQQHSLCPKLTEDHINPTKFKKTKVKLAAQIFSATVAAALKSLVEFGQFPSIAVATANFIEKLDKLFDLLNSSENAGDKEFNKPFQGADSQIKYLQEMVPFFRAVKVYYGNTDVTYKMKFLEGWQISINSCLGLWDRFHSLNIGHFYTRRLNLDCFENFFSSVRKQERNFPNPKRIQCEKLLKKLFFLKYFHHSKGSNGLII